MVILSHLFLFLRESFRGRCDSHESHLPLFRTIYFPTAPSGVSISSFPALFPKFPAPLLDFSGFCHSQVTVISGNLIFQKVGVCIQQGVSQILRSFLYFSAVPVISVRFPCPGSSSIFSLMLQICRITTL